MIAVSEYRILASISGYLEFSEITVGGGKVELN